MSCSLLVFHVDRRVAIVGVVAQDDILLGRSDNYQPWDALQVHLRNNGMLCVGLRQSPVDAKMHVCQLEPSQRLELISPRRRRPTSLSPTSSDFLVINPPTYITELHPQLSSISTFLYHNHLTNHAILCAKGLYPQRRRATEAARPTNATRPPPPATSNTTTSKLNMRASITPKATS